MFPERRRQSGFGLPMAVFVITILAVIIAAMSSVQENSGASSALQVNAHRALFTAESGVQASLNLLIPPDGSPGQACTVSPFYTRTFTVSGLNNCSVSVSCSSVTVNGDNFYTLTSTGRCGSATDAAQRILEVRAL